MSKEKAVLIEVRLLEIINEVCSSPEEARHLHENKALIIDRISEKIQEVGLKQWLHDNIESIRPQR